MAEQAERVVYTKHKEHVDASYQQDVRTLCVHLRGGAEVRAKLLAMTTEGEREPILLGALLRDA